MMRTREGAWARLWGASGHAMLVALLALAMVWGAGCSDDGGSNNGANNGTNAGSTGTNTGTTAAPDAGQDVLEDVEDDVDDTDAPDPDTGDVEDEDAVTCEPNTILGCVVENSQAIYRCNARGNQIFESSCSGQTVCREGECVEVACIPGKRECQDDTTPLLCAEDGSGYIAQDACVDGATCNNGACLDPCQLAAESRSYVGCEYWPVELPNYLLYDDESTSTPNAPFAVVLSNPNNEPARVTVYTPEGGILDAIPEVFIPKGLVDPAFVSTTVYTELLDTNGERIGEPLVGPLEQVEMPPLSQLQILFPSEPGERRVTEQFASTVSRLAWRVVSDRPVAAYQFNPICCNYSFTNDASLLLPTGTLTENYRVMSYPSWVLPADPLPATLTVVATQDNTEVTVRLSDRRIFPGNIPEPDVDGVVRVTLQAQEVLNIETAGGTPPADLSGTEVEASLPVAVFGGHVCTFIPVNDGACDHLEQQMFPLETWGRNYIVAPLKLRNPERRTREATYWKFMARDDNTEILLDQDFNDLEPLPQTSVTPNCRDKLVRNDTIALNEGETCEFGTRGGFSFNSTAPLLVGAFMSGQASAGFTGTFGNLAGDPAFFLVSPQEQFRQDYAFLTPVTYALDYITVLAPVGTRLTLDGAPLELTEFEHDFVPGQNHIYAHIPVEEGPHLISGDLPFGLVVYAYDDYVSYAFTGGLNLTKLDEEP